MKKDVKYINHESVVYLEGHYNIDECDLSKPTTIISSTKNNVFGDDSKPLTYTDMELEELNVENLILY